MTDTSSPEEVPLQNLDDPVLERDLHEVARILAYGVLRHLEKSSPRKPEPPSLDLPSS